MLDQRTYLTLRAVDIARLVNTREVSAVEVIQAALRRLALVEPTLKAFRDCWPDAALTAAREIDQRVAAGQYLSLAGVPLAVKAWEALDSPQPRRLRDAGCVPIGSTAVPGPGTAWQTWGHTDRGPTANPWRVDRSPGGSSAGSAAAVAAGVVPLATGIDGAGSIRIPAAWCGVLGLKLTGGAVPTRGRAGLTAAGPLCRGAADGARYLEVVLDPGARPTTAPAALERTVRVGWSPDLGFAQVAPEQRDMARAAATRLAGAGIVDEVPTSVRLLDPHAAWRATRANGGDQPEARAVRDENNRRLRELFEVVDVLLTPTTPGPAHPHTGPGSTINATLTWAFNLSGHPAMSLPSGVGTDGCPAGLQLVTRPGDERLLLSIAARGQRLPVGWPSRPPELGARPEPLDEPAAATLV